MKIIIAGSRDFDDYELLKEFCDSLCENYLKNEIEIVSGRARGADRLGERYAKENNYSIKYFPANWDKYGKSAGYRRNAEMAEYAYALIAFWDGKSKGTKHMIDLANKNKLNVSLICFNPLSKIIKLPQDPKYNEELKTMLEDYLKENEDENKL